LTKDRVRSTSPSSSHNSSGDIKSIERKTKDKYERLEQSYSSLKYSEATCSVQKTSEDKYERSTKDNMTDKQSYDSRSRRYDEEKDNCNKKSKQRRKDDVRDRRSYRTPERYDEIPGMERNQRRKHKLDGRKKEHKYHKQLSTQRKGRSEGF
jgi:hypothetical protein